MKFENGRFTAQAATELIEFANFLGDASALSLQSPVKDSNDNIFLQAHRPLNGKFLQALLERERSGNLKMLYEVENNDRLKDIIAEKLARRFQQKLNRIEFSFIDQIFGSHNLPLQLVIKTAVKNNFFNAQMALDIWKKDELNNHCLEVALYSLALLIQSLPQISLASLVVMLQAALLHDIGIQHSKSWQDEDSFENENEHDKIGSVQIPDSEIYEKLKPVIQAHHRLSTQVPTSEPANEGKLMYHILNLVEFFFFLQRGGAEKNEPREGGEKIFYQIAYHAQKGAFPESLVALMEGHHRKYASIFTYAKKIAQIENACPHKHLAVAYPKPKVTQILCTDNALPCSLRQVSQPIHIVQNNQEMNLRLGISLTKGWHSKCALGEQIPAAPDEL